MVNYKLNSARVFVIFSVPSGLQRPLYLKSLCQSILQPWWLCEPERVYGYVLPQPGRILGQVVPLGTWLVICLIFIMEKRQTFLNESINSCLFLGITCMYLSSRWAKQIWNQWFLEKLNTPTWMPLYWVWWCYWKICFSKAHQFEFYSWTLLRRNWYCFFPT